METVLVLRTCKADLTSFNGFHWPESGSVECPDWNSNPICGNGLHGLLWGQGDGSLLDWSPEAKWLVVEVIKDEIVDLDGKVKFPKGNVIFCGSRQEATRMIYDKAPQGTVVVGVSVDVGDGESVIVGDGGTAEAGNYGKALAGICGTAQAGVWGTAEAGNCGTAEAGNYGKALAGNHGTAMAGDDGKAMAGDCGNAQAGICGTATAGNGGTAQAGAGGRIQIEWYDSKSDRFRTAIGYVGEDGILPDVPYKVDHDTGKFVRA